MIGKQIRLILLIGFLTFPYQGKSEESVARRWNEAILEAIRHDLARPTIQARNLFHCAVAMYDAWAVYDSTAQTFLLGKTVGGYSVPYTGILQPADREAARSEAISYAAHRLLKHRFTNSPGAADRLRSFDSLLVILGYDTLITTTDYAGGSPAALGNYIGQSVINFGLQDGANEENDYDYQHYIPSNPPLILEDPGNPDLVDPNRWQPLTFINFIDQNGNVISTTTPKFVSPEWGWVTPFALTPDDLTVHGEAGYDQLVYNDPGPPARIDTLDGESEESRFFKWGFELVSVWSSHLQTADSVVWDISPRSIGNILELPGSRVEIENFYDLEVGGDHGPGRTVNPKTGQPYSAQFVPRGDYVRVLAEFWADGPKSETPPGHWFTILNYVSDHPAVVKRMGGQGPVLDDLQWDVKSYFALGGAVHDAAIAAWGIKGYYDYGRPISVIRWMAERGQSSDSTLPHFHQAGLPLIPGFIELVQLNDSLAGQNNVNVGKIKLHAWRAHSSISNPDSDIAGVGWILAENWWPYQRPTFVTPPFAGYVSGHSTFSRAAAEVLTMLTGDEYFPGGMGEFYAPRNQFLVFEEGPSVDVYLQWATYRDAADQCSLSRIWGGIHPPIDDIPGRIIGKKIGPQAFEKSAQYFSGGVTDIPHQAPSAERSPTISVYPNPVRFGNTLTIAIPSNDRITKIELFNILGQLVDRKTVSYSQNVQTLNISTEHLAPGVYFVKMPQIDRQIVQKVLVVK